MDIDNVGLDCTDFFESQAEARNRIWANIVDEDIALLDQLPYGRLTGFRFQVPDDGALTSINRQMAWSHATIVRRLANIAKIIPSLWLYLYDIRAHVGQGLRAIRTENDCGHVRNLDVRQKVSAWHVAHPPNLVLLRLASRRCFQGN